MRLFQPDRSVASASLTRVLTILGILAILLASVALINVLFGLLDRFRTGVYLFVIGALLAYLMAPIVRVLQWVVRKHWAAVLGAYLLLFAGVLAFGALLLTPFISQAQSLVKNLQNPSATSLAGIRGVQRQLNTIEGSLKLQQTLIDQVQGVPKQQVQKTQADIAALVREVQALTTAKPPPGAVQIPTSYTRPIGSPVTQLQAAYAQVTTSVGIDWLARSRRFADAAVSQANLAYQKASSSPLLLLSVQTLFDERGITVDLHDRFSEALKGVNDQVTSLLNNALDVSLQAGNLLLDIVLIFIISIYFLRDGGRFVQWLVGLVPVESRPRAARAVSNLDHILGRYLRTQIVLALLAGISDAVGAVVLGVPYAIVIFFSSFLLSLVPVLGPIVLPVPPLVIAMLFSPLPQPFFYLAWLLIGEQVITNIVGPRLQAHSLSIHPLEAMGAALAGLPLAGLPGAFFAVPIVAFLHIFIREIVSARLTSAPEPESPDANPPRAVPSVDPVRPASDQRRAVGEQL